MQQIFIKAKNMKFTKEQAVEELTAKITAKDKDLDLSRTINECVENALKMVGENEELELSQFVAFVQPFVSTAAGLGRKNAAVATKTLQDKIAELENQVKAKQETVLDKNEPNDEIKDLLSRLEKLEKDKAENEKAQRIAEKRKNLSSSIKKLGVEDSNWVDAFLSEVSITEDTDVEQKAKDYVALYNKTHLIDGSPTPKLAGGGGTEKIDLSGLDNALKQIRGNFGYNQTDNK